VPDSYSIFEFTLHYLAPVGAVMLLGLLGGKLARKIGLPKVTGYIVTGMLIGPSVFGLISFETARSLSLINDIALGLILFAIGGAFEIHHIRTIGRKVLWLTIGQSLGVMVLVTGLLYVIGMDLYAAALIGTIGIATAPAATLLVVREFQAKGDFTDTMITVVGTSNVVCILAFELVFGIGQLPGDSSFFRALLGPLYEIGGSLIVGSVLGYLIAKWEQHVEDQAEMLMIILAGVLLVTGLSRTLGLQPLFAALIMGAVTTNLSLMHRLVYAELRGVEQPIYIAFFVIAGASLHLEFLPALGLAGFAYLVARVLGKVLGAYLIARWKRYSADVANYLGISTVVQAGVAIGLVEIVNESNPELGDIVTPLILATILIYETFGPPIIKYVLIKVGDAKIIDL
jgi:Kef-type K+ transport system membrane component KefB